MVGNCSTLHPTNFHLHYILKKASSNKIIEFSLERRVMASELDYLVVKIINIVFDLVPQRSSCTCLDFKHDVVAVLVISLCVDLRSHE